MSGGSGSGDTGGRLSFVAVLSRWETSPPFCFSFTKGTSTVRGSLHEKTRTGTSFIPG